MQFTRETLSITPTERVNLLLFRDEPHGNELPCLEFPNALQLCYDSQTEQKSVLEGGGEEQEVNGGSDRGYLWKSNLPRLCA